MHTHTRTLTQVRLKTLLRNAEREVDASIKAREKTDHPNGFEATIEELERQREGVVGDDEENERETNALRRKIKDLEKSMSKLKSKHGKLMEKQGRLRAKIESSRDMEDRLDVSIRDLASKYCVAVPSQQVGTQSQQGSSTLQVATTFKQRLGNLFTSKEAQLKERQKQCESELSTLREEMDKNKLKTMQFQQTLDTQSNIEKEAREERRKLEITSDRLRKSVSGSDDRLKSLQDTISALEKDQKNGKHAEEMKRLKDSITQCDRELASLEFEMKRLEDERRSVEEESAAMQQIELLRKRLVQCEESERGLRDRLVSKGFETLIGHPLDSSTVESDFREALKTVHNEETDRREDREDTRQTIAVAKSEARSASKILAELERKKRNCLRETGVFGSIISSMSLLEDAKTLQDALKLLAGREKELEVQNTTRNHGADFCDFLEQRSTQGKSCACCGRGMSKSDIQKMISMLEKLREEMEDKDALEDAENELEELREIRTFDIGAMMLCNAKHEKNLFSSFQPLIHSLNLPIHTHTHTHTHLQVLVLNPYEHHSNS
jgi:predicted  nucleic acid-binding Zn-ribbon protein